MYKIYGIPNCNTVKKALNHLDSSKKEYEFINFKKTPPTKTQLKLWKDAFGDWPVNKKGPTYRKIKEEFEAANAAEKYKILIETTSAIKRPILMKNDKVITFGYDEDAYKKVK
ncbi:MAG: arsenate reductase [Halobacteriovoraceae bacterium]|nr:arsenate reductase [Halobacteriovoraceae bacterium]|tara:strand:+ start:5221 stop:5559 length:339 start_codon:yes stop_codon:yes gene_type:complete